ncbi:MAG: hypothetical protein GY874_04020, partial [Desulfobacteraceae bacterium]|nr:hypothetical protein [Desulfobacteraceae bacterium]
MKPISKIKVAFWGIALAIFFIVTQASAELEIDPPLPYNSFPHMIPEINNYSGAVTQRIPITVPPGRNGIQPDLAFSYSSFWQTGHVGKGWKIPIDAIQRQTKRGVKYDQDQFEIHTDGLKTEFVPIGNDYFRLRIEKNFSQYYYNRSANYWEVTQKDGTKFYFGYYPITNAYGNSRQKDGSWGTFKWCLSQVIDTNGNYMSISYTQDQGQVYPSHIDYTGNMNSGLKPSNRVMF